MRGILSVAAGGSTKPAEDLREGRTLPSWVHRHITAQPGVPMKDPDEYYKNVSTP